MESIVQNGRLVITRRFNESFIIRPDAKVRALLPVEVLFRTPIVVTLQEGDGEGQFQVCVEADKRLNILRSELVNKTELQQRTSLLYRDDIDLVDHQHALKDESTTTRRAGGMMKAPGRGYITFLPISTVPDVFLHAPDS